MTHILEVLVHYTAGTGHLLIVTYSRPPYCDVLELKINSKNSSKHVGVSILFYLSKYFFKNAYCGEILFKINILK